MESGPRPRTELLINHLDGRIRVRLILYLPPYTPIPPPIDTTRIVVIGREELGLHAPSLGSEPSDPGKTVGSVCLIAACPRKADRHITFRSPTWLTRLAGRVIPARDFQSTNKTGGTKEAVIVQKGDVFVAAMSSKTSANYEACCQKVAEHINAGLLTAFEAARAMLKKLARSEKADIE